jgi:hypothetical protein
VLSDQELLGQIRRFFLALQTFSEVTLQDFAIPTAVSEYAQGVFVELRKQEHETSAGKELKTTAETFHQWLTLSRLIALSQGYLELTQGHFDLARSLESKRLARIPASPSPAKPQ